ncbi:flagellar motor switch protein FliM, partial [Pseudomonas aeruginosa]
LRRSADIAVVGVQDIEFGEDVHSRYVPARLHLVKVKVLSASALVILDAKLVLDLVDTFVGGHCANAKIEAREVIPTELRVVRM